ncbi:MAG: hypothetical protein JRI72_07145 [Deltaproteobacteria bacterium]|nr:hypothetical protein [Deltaproteobacteria bacterium]
MTDKNEIIEQTNLAFDFIQKLYLEVSYLIKEVEGILREEEEKFLIGKPGGGYAITGRRSMGLESVNVNLWLLRKFAVFFVPEDKTEVKGGQLITNIDDDLKVLYLRIVLSNKDIEEPAVYSGVLHDINTQSGVKGITRFEHIMGHLEYNDEKIFKNVEKINYEDARIKLQGDLIKNNLFEINDSETILEKIINPSLALYRRY